MADLPEIARSQFKESVIAYGPKERSAPDGMERKTTEGSLADSGYQGMNNVETDAVPSNEDIPQALEMRDQLGVSQDIPEQSTEEDKPIDDKEKLPDLVNSLNDTKNVDSPNSKNQEQQQKIPSNSGVLPEEQVARVEDRNQTQSSYQGVRAKITDKSNTDIGHTPIEDIDLAKVHISDQHHGENQGDTTTLQPNTQPATCPKKPNIRNAAVFPSEAQTATETISQETNTPTSEHHSQVHGSVASVSRDIGELAGAAQPDSKLNMAVALPSSQPCPQTAGETVTSPHKPTQETGTLTAQGHPSSLSGSYEEEYFDVLLLHSEHDKDHVETFMEIAERYSWKVTSPEEFEANQYKSYAFNSAFERSSFTVLLLTGNFLADVWCELRYQTALVQSIENPAKRFCVIPVTCEDKFKMPMELSILTGVKINSANFEKALKRTIRVDRRIQRVKAAASATPEILGVEAAELSLDELYNKRRPELNPGQFSSQVFPSDETFREICVHLDKDHPLNRDWRLLAEIMGFKASSIRTLKHEQSPTAQILECFCHKQRAQGESRESILEILRTKLRGIHRLDIENIL